MRCLVLALSQSEQYNCRLFSINLCWNSKHLSNSSSWPHCCSWAHASAASNAPLMLFELLLLLYWYVWYQLENSAGSDGTATDSFNSPGLTCLELQKTWVKCKMPYVQIIIYEMQIHKSFNSQSPHHPHHTHTHTHSYTPSLHFPHLFSCQIQMENHLVSVLITN